MNSQYEVFFLSAFGAHGAVEELNTFMRSHKVLNVDRKAIDSERGTGWMVFVEYLLNAANEVAVRGQKIDYKALLGDDDYLLFNKLRDERARLAKIDGIPVWSVATNDHLVTMIKNKVATLESYLELPGMSPKQGKKYGQAMVDCLKSQSSGGQTSLAEEAADQTAGKSVS